MSLYFDYAATTPLDPRVHAAMQPYWSEAFGNPASLDSARGRTAEQEAEGARARLAKALNCDPRELIFTSGATEANNLALKGAMLHLKRLGKTHLITSATEHKCVLESANWLQTQGFELTLLKPEPDGGITPDAVEEALRPETGLVSLMLVNNETGRIQPIAQLAELLRPRGIWLHSDAAQGLGKTQVDIAALNVDLLSLSSHKAYGPMGLGALYVRRRPRVRLEPLLHGGGQERGLRSGTLPLPLIMGFAKAVELAQAEQAQDTSRLQAYRAHLIQTVEQLAGAQVLSDPKASVPHITSLSLPAVSRDALFARLEGFDLSSGSACSAADLEPSYVLQAMGLSYETALRAVRISMGRFTQEADLNALTTRIGTWQPKPNSSPAT